MAEADRPTDDPTIADETELYRRVSPAHYKVVDGEFILREGAFKNFPRPELKRLSVVLGDRLSQLGRTPETILGPHHGKYGVVAIKAQAFRDEGQLIERTPREEEPAHGDVYGDKPASVRKRLVPSAVWIVYPTL